MWPSCRSLAPLTYNATYSCWGRLLVVASNKILQSGWSHQAAWIFTITKFFQQDAVAEVGPLWMCQQGTPSHAMTVMLPGFLQHLFKLRLSHSAPWSASCPLPVGVDGYRVSNGSVLSIYIYIIIYVYLQIVNFWTGKMMVFNGFKTSGQNSHLYHEC